MSDDDRVDVCITLKARWVEGLVGLMADPAYDVDPDLWGFQFHPIADKGAVIVAGSRHACVVIRDSETKMVGTHGGRPIVVTFGDGFLSACRTGVVVYHDCNGDRYEVDEAPWMIPDKVLVSALGIGTQWPQVTWFVKPRGFPPGLEKRAENMAWALARGGAAASFVRDTPFPWECVVAPLPLEPISGISVQPRFLEVLRHFGSQVTLKFAGRHERIVATFPDVPEVTVAIMPLKLPDESGESAS